MMMMMMMMMMKTTTTVYCIGSTTSSVTSRQGLHNSVSDVYEGEVCIAVRGLRCTRCVSDSNLLLTCTDAMQVVIREE